jgi:hypothetical protein
VQEVDFNQFDKGKFVLPVKQKLHGTNKHQNKTYLMLWTDKLFGLKLSFQAKNAQKLMLILSTTNFRLYSYKHIPL